MNKLFSIGLVLILSLSCLEIYGASADGGDAGAFMKNGIGVRSISMGKAFVAVADDASAGYWNPAGLHMLKDAQISLMYSNPMNYDIGGTGGVKGIGYHTMSLAYPTNSFGSIGLNVAYLSVGNIFVVKDSSGPTGETFDDKELGVIFSYANKVTDQVHLGLNFKLLRQSMWDKSGSGVGLDIGGLYEPMLNLRLGAVLQDIVNPKIKLMEREDTVPRKLILGASYRFINDKVLIATGVDKPSARSAKFHFGAEVLPISDLSLRAGYTTDSGEISFGIGVRFSVLKLDYGFGLLKVGSTHRVSLTVTL